MPHFLLLLLLVLVSSTDQAQGILVPGEGAFEKKWLVDEEYRVTWYALRDTTKLEIGEVVTQVEKEKEKLSIITRVSLKNMPAPWVDTTIALAHSLQPVYHSSYNMQRDMVLHFGKLVNGYYHDKTRNTQTPISDTTTGAYFDSNLYPTLIRWLPLKEGFRQAIAIYDHNPSGKTGILEARVEEVSSGTYHSNNAGAREVWIVRVTDDLGGPGSSSVYFIDKTDRKLWAQEINTGKARMLMTRKE